MSESAKKEIRRLVAVVAFLLAFFHGHALTAVVLLFVVGSPLISFYWLVKVEESHPSALPPGYSNSQRRAQTKLNNSFE